MAHRVSVIAMLAVAAAALMQVSRTRELDTEPAGEASLALVGGCGSSGTTLLAHLLSRHTEIVSGPEIDVFNHREAWSPNELARSLDELFARRRLSDGYKLVVDFCKPAEEFGIDANLVAQWAEASGDLAEFARLLAAHVCGPTGAAWFVEKTPTNVYGFEAVSKAARGLPLVHQIRDGRDVAASLVRRGKPLFYAGSRWLYDTVAGLRARGCDGYVELRYEDLVTDARGVLVRVLALLGLEFEDTMLVPATAARTGQYDERWRARRAPRRWASIPSEGISARSVGCYARELSRDELSMLYRIRLTERAAEELAAPVRTFAELLELLGYATGPERSRPVPVLARVRESAAEVFDYLARARRTLRYTRRLPRALTRVGFDRSPRSS
jgi:hypothetical protein